MEPTERRTRIVRDIPGETFQRGVQALLERYLGYPLPDDTTYTEIRRDTNQQTGEVTYTITCTSVEFPNAFSATEELQPKR